MADGSCNNLAENDVVELEAMRKDSFSWHPCEVSLCSRGLGLIVRYGDYCLEETIEDKQEVLARVRVRSTPLQGDDCSSLQQGDHVLATENLHANPDFYDGWVEEAIRVRHSKRNHCRCSFKIKWLHLDGEEAVTAPASAIMKLATKSISLHPTISTFFSKLKSSNRLDSPPRFTFVDSLNWEMDINVLLEKQIEEISNSTDASQKKVSKNFIFGLEVDLKGQSPGLGINASLEDPPVAIPLLNNLNGSTGSENKQPMETIIESAPAYISSAQEKFTGSRSLLSPLAARAALASLRSEFPQSAELSVKSNVEKGDITSEHSTTKLLHENRCCSFSAVDRSENTDDFLLTVSATLGGKSSNFEGTKKTLFQTSGAAEIVEVSNVSSRSLVNGMERKDKISEKKISQPSETRFTRAQIRRSNGMHVSTQMTNTTRRVTRSAVNRVEKIEVEEHNAEVEENTQTKCVELGTSAQETVARQNCLSDNQKLVASPIHGETSVHSGENDKSHLGKDGMVVKVDPQKGTFAEDANKHNYPKRLTRSVAREEVEMNNVLPKLKSSSTSVSESNELDLFKENVSAKSNKLELEKSLTSPIATKISEQFTEESDKSRERFHHVNTTPACTESVVGSSQGIKRKSATSKKQETRFSPRLRYLPRTRSQNKA